MEIKFIESNDRVKISDYPFGTVFAYDGLVYMKIGLHNSNANKLNDYGFVHLKTGLRPHPSFHQAIDYGSVEILDAILEVKRKK
jgi:hypothetical protein